MSGISASRFVFPLVTDVFNGDCCVLNLLRGKVLVFDLVGVGWMVMFNHGSLDASFGRDATAFAFRAAILHAVPKGLIILVPPIYMEYIILENQDDLPPLVHHVCQITCNKTKN